jgi:hypothetical protein
VKVGVQVEGLNETLRAFNRYGRDANKELRAAAAAEVDRILPALTAAATAAGPQAAMTASSVRRRSDRVPVITAGGSRRIRKRVRSFQRRATKLSSAVSAGDVFFGAEFGGGGRPSTRQFPPYRGHAGYWFWPTLRHHLPELRRRYIRALDELAARWAQGGDEHG